MFFVKLSHVLLKYDGNTISFDKVKIHQAIQHKLIQQKLIAELFTI
jgi:hypothetical protein